MKEIQKLQKDKVIIKIKMEGDLCWPENNKATFQHCTNGASAVSELQLAKLNEVFALHGVELYY